ncbi:MAG: carbohydrate-binding protein [Thermoplasmata archaeon]
MRNKMGKSYVFLFLVIMILILINFQNLSLMWLGYPSCKSKIENSSIENLRNDFGYGRNHESRGGDRYGNGSRDAKLDFVFLLHMNQALVPYGEVADDLCYYKIISTLRSHPRLNFTLHVSGTLISDLLWYDNRTLSLIMDGIREGQFEILGSTYSQSVMYSCEDYDNRVSVELHKKQLSELFGVSPSGFWNAERCWNQSRLLPVIADAGYSYTFIEDKILVRASDYSGIEHCVRKTSFGGKEIYVFNDDRDAIKYDSTDEDGYIDRIALRADSNTRYGTLSQRIDYAISTLNSIYSMDSLDEACVVYAQDCEAWGLWQEEGGSNGADSDDVENVAARLDAFLTRIENTPWLRLTKPSDFIKEMNMRSYQYKVLSTIPDGAAAWMDVNAKKAGYADWIAWQSSGVLSEYRNSFSNARDKLRNAENMILSAKNLGKNTSASEKILEIAKIQYVSCMFEFGCWGCLFKWYHQSKCSGIAVEAALKSLEPPTSKNARIKDVDSDGNEEYIIENQAIFAVFSKQGGRLIALFDIVNGTSYLYNDAPATYTSKCPDYSSLPLCTCSESITGTDLWGRTTKTYWLRHKCFADYVDGNFVANYPYIANLQSTEAKITFSYSNSGKSITKEVSILDLENMLSVAYSYSGFTSVSFCSEITLSLGLDSFTPKRADTKIITDKGNFSYSYDTRSYALPSNIKELGIQDSDGRCVIVTSNVELNSTSYAHVLAYSFKTTPSYNSYDQYSNTWSMRFNISFYRSEIGSEPIYVKSAWCVPERPRKGENVTIYYSPKVGKLGDDITRCVLHWGINGWNMPPIDSLPASSVVSYGVVDTPMLRTGEIFSVKLETDFRMEVINFVFTDGIEWDNNDGVDYSIQLQPSLDRSKPIFLDVNVTLNSTNPMNIMVRVELNEDSLCSLEYGMTDSYGILLNGTGFKRTHVFNINIGKIDEFRFYKIKKYQNSISLK